MNEDEIIVIDKIEEAQDKQGKRYLKVTDKAGVTRNFKEGRSNLLTNKEHFLKEGVAIKLQFQDYKTPDGKVFPFVKDFEVVEDVFVAQAAEKFQGQAKEERADSIEAQVAQKGGIEILKVLIEQALLTDQEIQKAKEYAMSSVDWGMGRINLPVVIIGKVEEAKATVTIEPPKEPEPEIKTAGQLFQWIMGKDPNIKAPRTWVNTNFDIDPKAILTEEKVKELYLKIRYTQKW